MMTGRQNQPPKWRWLTAIAMCVSLLSGILISESANAQAVVNRETGSPKTALATYATDMTAAAEQGRFNSIEAKRELTDRALQILASEQKNNPVVISESQAVRDVIVIGVAQRMVAGDVPDSLAGKRLFKLNLEKLFHDSSNAEELKNNLSAILSDVAKSEARVILIVDPVQSLIGSAAAFNGAASELLLDAIKKGDVQCFGATTDVAYQQNVAPEQSLASLFTAIETQEATKADDQADQDSSTPSTLEPFVGDNVSPDMRELISNSNAPARVQAILQVNNANSEKVRASLAKYGARIEAEMPRFGALAVDLPTSAIEKIADETNANYLSLDRGVSGLGHVEITTGDDAMIAEAGNSLLDGSSIGVAILDSGISTKHKSLAGSVVLSKDFTGEGTTDDLYGHGTFVASMIVTKRGSYGGIAPGANLVNFRVLDGKGLGTTSALLNALNAVALNRTAYNIRVVNMSLGIPAVDSYRNDPVCRAVRRLVDMGIVVVAAAGNDGKDATHPKVYGRIHSPGNEPSAITVGAANTFGTDVRSDDNVTSFSSRGPTRSYWKDLAGVKHYDNLIKPDLVAPGNKLMGAASPNNNLEEANPDLCVSACGASSHNGKGVMTLSGTSVASPIVSGTVAVLLEANPKLTPNMVKMILMYTAQQLKGSNMFEQGAGELNVEGAVRLAKLVRTDLNVTTAVGSPLLTGPAPVAQSSISGETFVWAQGVIFSYNWASGSELITKYQGIYGLGVLASDGITMSDGVLTSDVKMLSGGVLVSDKILTSNGITMSDGTVFLGSGVLVGDGAMVGDGVLVGDGVMSANGVMTSNGIMTSDGIMSAEGVMSADSYRGDKTACMAAE